MSDPSRPQGADPTPVEDHPASLAELVAGARELLEWEQVLVGSASTLAVPPAAGRVPSGRRPSKPSAGAAPPALPAPAPLESDERRRRLEVVAREAAECTRCDLHRGRTRVAVSRGTGEAGVMFVGEGPGYHEDQQGKPFVGAAGQLLDKMIAAMGLDREHVYVCNVVKCRPPDNRTPFPDEAAACEPFLREQIDCVRPRVIVALGRCATEHLGCLGEGRGWRGRWGSYRGTAVMPTYHPAFLLRNENMKRPVWQDLQEVMKRLPR